MEQDLVTNLPQEIGIDIFSRLSIPSIINCKRVCKAWRHLLSTPDFVGYHCSKSLPGLVLSKGGGESSSRYKILEFVGSGGHPCKTVYDFSVPRRASLDSSAKGLLLFVNYKNDTLYVCNPLTREYINLPPTTESHLLWIYGYGFGVSKMSGEYKVVRITKYTLPYKFEVYTLGTGSWRNLVVPAGGVAFPGYHPCVFVDGKLYSWPWVEESCVSCFDLETEVLSTVSCPSSRGYYNYPHLCALEGRLCLCLNNLHEVVIWVMHEVQHWTKEFVIRKAKMDGYRCESFKAFKVLGDGEMLVVMERAGELYHYSRKSQTLKSIGFTINRRNIYRVGYTPTFLLLKTFAIENVCSF